MNNIKQHTNLSELISDLRNKMGSIVSYFDLMNIIDKYPEKKELLNIFNKNKKTAKKSIKIIKNLFHQFENFNLSKINNE